MRAVDPNVIVRIVTRDDEKQAASADEFIARGAWVSHVVLAETAWVLGVAYDLDHRAIATAIEMLLSHESLTIQEAEVVASALEHYRRKPSLGFSDCLLLEIARKAGHVPLGTFDKALSSLPDTQRL